MDIKTIIKLKTDLTFKKQQLINDILINCCFFIWLAFAFYFWQERLYGDAGFYIAKVVDYECFRLEVGRYVRGFTQWLPLLLIKLNYSLKTVLISYSVGHVFFFYAIYLIGRFHFKNHFIGWLVIAMQVIGMGYAFTTQGFEFYYAAALSIILLLVMYKNGNTKKHYFIIFIFTSFLVLNYLLITLILIAFIALHYYQYKGAYWKLYMIMFAAIGISVFIKQYLWVFEYEQERSIAFIHNLWQYDWSWKYAKKLIAFLWEYYYDLLGIILFTTFVMLKRREFLIAVGYWFFILGALWVATLSFPGVAHTRYQEQCYFLWIVIVVLPLFTVLYAKVKPACKKWWQVMFFGLILFRFGIIYQSMEIFTQRVELMHRLISHAQKIEGNKFIINEKNIKSTIVRPFFTFSMETMLLSAACHPKTVSIALDSYIAHGDNRSKLENPNLYISTKRGYYERPDSLHEHQSCNTRYFNFQPHLYQSFHDSYSLTDIEDLATFLVLKPSTNKRYPKAANIFINTEIQNKSNIPLPSSKIRLVYRWWKNGEMLNLNWLGYHNPLEVDILPHSNYTQPIKIHTPKDIGDYELQIIPQVGQKILDNQYPKRIPITIQ